MEIMDSARKHGLTDEDIRHAVDNALDSFPVTLRAFPDTDALGILGPDMHGNTIEVFTFLDGDSLVAIHAMKARSQYLD